MLDLSNVTLVAMTSVKVDATIEALKWSSKDIKFASIKLITDVASNNVPSNILIEKIDKMRNIDEYSYSMIYKLGDYIDTPYAMVVQYDGFIVNPKAWRSEFFEYDYIGAPWSMPSDSFSYRDKEGNIVRVGNGGVSLRSKKIIDLPNKLNLEWKPFHGYYNEDGFICTGNRHIYIENGINFADVEVAKYFSHEAMIPEIQGIEPFAFHKWAGTNSKYPRF